MSINLTEEAEYQGDRLSTLEIKEHLYNPGEYSAIITEPSGQGFINAKIRLTKKQLKLLKCDIDKLLVEGEDI